MSNIVINEKTARALAETVSAQTGTLEQHFKELVVECADLRNYFMDADYETHCANVNAAIKSMNQYTGSIKALADAIYRYAELLCQNK